MHYLIFLDEQKSMNVILLVALTEIFVTVKTKALFYTNNFTVEVVVNHRPSAPYDYFDC